MKYTRVVTKDEKCQICGSSADSLAFPLIFIEVKSKDKSLMVCHECLEKMRIDISTIISEMHLDYFYKNKDKFKKKKAIYEGGFFEGDFICCGCYFDDKNKCPECEESYIWVKK